MLAFIRPKAHPRYLELPLLGSIVDEFTVWSHSRGYTIGTIRNQLKDVRLLDGYFQKNNIQCLLSPS